MVHSDLVDLASRALDVLPSGLTSLELNNISTLMQSAFREVWNHRDMLLHLNPSSSFLVANNEGEVIKSSTATTPNTWISMICRFHLPHLREFTYTPALINSLLYRDVISKWFVWGDAHLPLTRLSLCSLTMSTFDTPLCDVFRVLPRTLTSLDLLQVQDKEYSLAYGNSFLFSSKHLASTDEYVNHKARILGALPPHLTRFRLDLASASHIPSTALSHLSKLITLKLNMGPRHPSDDDSLYNSVPPYALSHLPVNVQKISLRRFSVGALDAYMSSVPDTHRSLRHLTIKNVIFLRSDLSLSDICFIKTITSHVKFARLESLHIFFGGFTFPFDDRNSAIYESMKQMIHLRSVSTLFMSHMFDSFWKAIASLLSPASPMRLRDCWSSPAHIDSYWVKNICCDSTSTPPHLVTDRLEFGKLAYRLLTSTSSSTMSHTTPCDDNVDTNSPLQRSPSSSSALTTLFQSIKHLTVDVSTTPDLDVAFVAWPSNKLEILNLNSNLHASMSDASLFTLGCMRTLRILTIEQTIDITNLSQWLRQLPETLEVLFLDVKRDTSKEPHILTYIPRRLQNMTITGGFAISTATFDAIPSSLRQVYWGSLTGLYCNASDLYRWPRQISRVGIDVLDGVCIPPEYIYREVDLKAWCKRATHLNHMRVPHYTENGEHFYFNYRSQERLNK